jgi:hypothetical protein
MKVAFLHVSDYAMISQQNKLSVIGIFRDVFAEHVPSIFPPFKISVGLETDHDDSGSEQHVQVRIIDADGNRLHEHNATLHVPEVFDLQDLNVVGDYYGLPLPSYGEYRVEVWIDETCRESKVIRAMPIPRPKHPEP